jgi:UDPglucose 6-dehydrogenase
MHHLRSETVPSQNHPQSCRFTEGQAGGKEMNLIIGYGQVGKMMHKRFPDADIYDPLLPPCWKEENKESEDATRKAHFVRLNTIKKYRVAFICVPTEMRENGECDVSIVERVISEWALRVAVFCIKSTVPPGTTDSLGWPAVFSPEFSSSNPYTKVIDSDFVILGGPKQHTQIVAEEYKKVVDSTFRIINTRNTKTAELVKYMDNSFNALKITFCNEFARAANVIRVDYEELRELWLLDPRVSRFHTMVHKDQPYYDSHCLNKDIPAIVALFDRMGVTLWLTQCAARINDLAKKGELK